MAVGAAFTVTVVVVLHPLLSLYVIMLVPAATPVTVPVVFAPLMIATVEDAEVQGLVAAAVPEPVNEVVPVPQIDKVPEMVGNPFLVTVMLVRELLVQLVVLCLASA